MQNGKSNDVILQGIIDIYNPEYFIYSPPM